MKSITDTLEALALTSIEIKIYLYLLEYGGQGVSAIATGTSLYRHRVYEALESLDTNGFIKKEKNGVRYVYAAEGPYVLLESVKNTRDQIVNILPELQKLREKGKESFSIAEFNGAQGLSACFLDVVSSLEKGDTFYRFSSAKDQDFVDSVVPKEYRPLRDQKQLERRVITSPQVGEQKKPRLERSIRYIDKNDEVFDHNIIQFIYGDKVSLLDFNSLTAVVIKSKAVADFQKSVFLTLYRRLDTV